MLQYQNPISIKAESQANWGISQLQHETSLFEAIMKPGDPD